MSNNILGQIEVFNMDITSPIKFKTDPMMEFRKLMVLVGQNGSGKSLLLKINFCLAYICSAVVMVKGLTMTQIIQITQETFNSSFDYQNFDGDIACYFTSGSKIEIKFDKGKVVQANCSIVEGVDKPTIVKYMSTKMRLFTDMDMYIKTRAMVKSAVSNPSNEQEIVTKMLTMYKLYDVNYMEGFIAAAPITITSDVQSKLKEDFGFDHNITTIGIDTNGSTYYNHASNPTEKIYTSTLGSGHQSILNMMMANLI